MAEKSVPVMIMRRGMVRMRTKGRAREKGLIFTNHSTPRHASWIRVKRCICAVDTCTEDSRGECDQPKTSIKIYKMLIYVKMVYRGIVIG